MLDRCWRDRRLAIVIVVAAAAGYGVVAGWWTPRGPNNANQALAAMALSIGVGLLSGVVLRTRWAIAVALVTFAGVFELARFDATGATVDTITLSSEYGILAFAVGRLFHGILALLPMAVGVAFGRSWAMPALPLAEVARADRGDQLRADDVTLR